MKTVLAAALTLLLGLFLGGLGPRAELRRTRKELEQAREEVTRSAGAGLPAALGLAGLAAARDRAQSDARSRVPRFTTPEKTEAAEPAADNGESRSGSERRGEILPIFGDRDGFAAAKAAADLRAAQFRAAFVAEARLDPQRQNALDGTISSMNAEFARAAGEIAETVTAKGKRVTPRDMADVGVRLLDIYRRADDSLKNGLDQSGRAALDKTGFDPLTQIDMEAFRKLAEAMQSAELATPGQAP